MNRIAVVTGGSGGIGQAIALTLARDHFLVIALYYKNKKKAEDLVLQARTEGNQIEIMPCDVTDINQTKKCFDEILKSYHHIDVLVYAAGISSIGLFTDTTEQEWNRIIETNLSGAYRCIYHTLSDMISRKKGSIVLISSMWGEVGASCEVAYSASKAALIGMSKALAKETGPSGIRVNCVTPGLIDTDMNHNVDESSLQAIVEDTPLGRIGSAMDVARTVSFLVSDDASFITGQVLGVSGGFVI